MKKKGILLLAILCCLVLVVGILAACNETASFTITFDTQGGNNIADITVGNGQVIGEVAPPTKQCARFVGFALDAGGERMWNLQTDTVSADITLYAIWEGTHTWGEWETLTEPTCTAEGAHKHICEVCGKEETENISKIEHDFIIWEYDENHHWKICSRCGAVSEKTAHVYDTDGKCECGAIAATPASEFTFTDLGNNTWSVDGYSGSDSAIVIPSRYNGGKVISIGDEAFAYCRGLTSVTIPDSVTSIGDYAFCFCDGLTSVTIGDGVTSIGDRAFSGCTGLTEINWNAVSVADFGSYHYVFYNAGTAGDGIAVTFGDSVEKIPVHLFFVGGSSSYSLNIKSVTIGAGVTSIGDYAFYNCSGLTSVTIPNSVTSIGSYAFYECTGLTEINWNAVSVADFNSNSDVFYNAGTAGDGITVTFGDSVERIPACAFYNCTGLTSVTIGDGVTSIGDSAFA